MGLWGGGDFGGVGHGGFMVTAARGDARPTGVGWADVFGGSGGWEWMFGVRFAGGKR